MYIKNLYKNLFAHFVLRHGGLCALCGYFPLLNNTPNLLHHNEAADFVVILLTKT